MRVLAPRSPAALLEVALDRAVAIPSGRLHAHVAAVRRRHPDASPAEVIAVLEGEYLHVLEGAGGAVGASAALPGVGTGTAVVLTTGDVAAYLAASAAFALAVASVHGIEVEDVPRRRALLMASLLGSEGTAVVAESAHVSGSQVARTLLTRLPAGTVTRVNRTLGRRLLRHELTRHSGVVIGRILPFGIGAVIGVTGGRALAREVIGGARTAFGPAPQSFP